MKYILYKDSAFWLFHAWLNTANDFQYIPISFVVKKKMEFTIVHVMLKLWFVSYCKTSSISNTKSQNLNVSCILLQLSSLNPLKPGVQLRMKM